MEARDDVEEKKPLMQGSICSRSERRNWMNGIDMNLWSIWVLFI